MKFQFLPKQPQTLAVIRQYMTAMSASLTFAGIGSTIAWPSPTLFKIKDDKETSIDEISWIVSLIYLGNLASALISEYLLVKYGPWKIIFYSEFVLIASWFLVITDSLTGLYIARFMAGFYCGLVLIAQPIYIADISQVEVRSTFNALNNFMFSAGCLFTFIIGPFVSYFTLAIVSLLLPIMFILTFWFVPESPYYSLSEGRPDRARESLLWLRGDINRIELEFEINQMERAVQSNTQNPGSYSELFIEKPLRKAIIIGIAFALIKCLSGVEIIQAFSSYTIPKSTLGILNPCGCVIIFGIASLFSSILATYMMNTFKRKPLLVLSFTSCCISTLLVGIWFSLDSHSEFKTNTLIPFLGFLIQHLFHTLGMSISTTVFNEIFPSRVKMKATVITTAVFAFISFISTKLYLTVKLSEGAYIYFAIFSASCFIWVLFVTFYLPETKSKTMQEIQDIFCGIERKQITTPVLSRTF